MIKYDEIREVHLELSTNCNASCPLCPRNFGGYPYNAGYPITQLTLEDIKKIFEPRFIAQLKILLINGNLGDFMLARDAIFIIEYFRSHNESLDILISTNGGSRNKEFWSTLAQYRATVMFCLDGLEDTHSIYRRDTKFDTVIKNAKTFISAGGIAIWKMIKFKHNEHQIDQCRALSKKLEFKDFNLIDHGRDSGYVYNRKGELEYTIGNFPEIPDREFPVTWHEQMSWGKEYVGRKDHYLEPVSEKISCNTKNNKAVFVTATGEVYPCCFLGFYPRTYDSDLQFGNDQVKELLGTTNINAKEKSFEECIEWFNQVEESWNKNSFQEGRLWLCNHNCGSTCQ